MLEQEKPTKNNVDAIIEQYFNTRNSIIAGSMLLIIIVVITVLFASGATPKDSPKMVKLEQRLHALETQQQAIQASLIDLINTVGGLKGNLQTSNNQNNDDDNSIPEPEVFMTDSFQSDNKQHSRSKRLSRPATDIELKRSNSAVIESKFESETVNTVWRNATESRIIQILERKRFNQTRFDQLQCKRTICKLEITHNKKSRSDKFLTEFPIALHDFDEIITVEPQENGNFITILFLQQR